jgi:thiosulfate dehydrogenase
MSRFLLGAVAGVLALGALAVLLLAVGLFPVGANGAPPAWERWIAKRSLDASVGRQAQRRANPVAPSDAELLAGLKLYRSNCAGCHGEGKSPSSWGAQFYPPVPQFGSQPPRKPDWQIAWIVENGLRYSGMGGWKGQMAEADIWRVASFLSRLDSLPPSVAAAWKPPAAR